MNKFERNNTDIFEFQLVSLGVIRRVRIWHDDSAAMSSWHLDHVKVLDSGSEREYNFSCNKWLSSKKDDKNLSRDLFCDNLSEEEMTAEAEDGVKEDEGYEVIINVSNKKEAGTKHDIWVSLEGSLKSTDKLELENKAGRYFNKGTSDLFYFPSDDIGALTHVRVGLTPREGVDVNKDPIKQCHLNQVIVNQRNTDSEYVFVCNHWLSLPGTQGRKSYRKLGLTTTQPLNKDHPARLRTAEPPPKTLTKYLVEVKTGDKFGAGTDANVYITIYGKASNSGKLALKSSGSNLFERNAMSAFELEITDLGVISKIRIEHDDSGIGASWHLEAVYITNQTSCEKLTFLCNSWIDKKKGDKQLFKVLWPQGRAVEDIPEEEETEEQL